MEEKEIFQKCSLKQIEDIVINGMSHYTVGKNYFRLIVASAFDAETKLDSFIQEINLLAKEQKVMGDCYLVNYVRILARFGKNKQAGNIATEITDNRRKFNALLYNAYVGKRKEDFEFLFQELGKICPYRTDDARAKIAEALAKIGEIQLAKQVAEKIEIDRIQKKIISNIDYHAKKIRKVEETKKLSGFSKIKSIYNFENFRIKPETLDQVFEDAIKIGYGEMATDVVREYLADNNIEKARGAVHKMKDVSFAEFFMTNGFLLVYLQSKDKKDLIEAFRSAHKCDETFMFKPAALTELALVTENTVMFMDACKAINEMPIFDDEQKLLEYVVKRMLGKVEPCSFENFRTAEIGEV